MSIPIPLRRDFSASRRRSLAKKIKDGLQAWQLLTLAAIYEGAKRGTRPSAPRDQRTASTYIFGAVCPKEGKGAALILPACNTEAMNLHLVEIAAIIAPGAHAVVLVDQAGWHMSTRLVVPSNITIVALPPKSPELNPVENIWQIHARQLALQSHLQILRRSRRSLL